MTDQPTAPEPAGPSDPTSEPDIETSAEEFGPPFVPKTFGGAFVWARAAGFTATVLRVRAGQNVPVSTENRTDMTVMLTGGRALLEVRDGSESDRVELVPAEPVAVPPGRQYRLLALTEVELFTVYTPLPPQ